MKRYGVIIIGCLLVAALVRAAEPERISLPKELVGPMLNNVTSTEATLWMYAPEANEVQVKVTHISDAPHLAPTITAKADPAEHNAIKARLTDLHPGERYEYDVLIDGKTNLAWRGVFRTAPAEGKPGRVKMAVTSCMDCRENPIQPSWYLLLAERPHFHLMIGDNVYSNTTDPEKLWSMHMEQRRVVEFAAVLRNVPTFAMWDDHDYGPNDSDGTLMNKEKSLAMFQTVFANPAAGTKETPGAFYRFRWGDVDVFMLDGRYHRSPDAAPNDDKKRMLGDAQFAWLAEGLKSSRAKFKVLASGSTLAASRDDGWRIYDYDRKRLYRTIMEQKIPGVIYVSGDIHRCQLDVRPASETGGYPLYEVTSSGVANSRTDGFATVEFDTTAPDPTLRIRIVHGDATTQLDRTIKLSELQVP